MPAQHQLCRTLQLTTCTTSLKVFPAWNESEPGAFAIVALKDAQFTALYIFTGHLSQTAPILTKQSLPESSSRELSNDVGCVCGVGYLLAPYVKEPKNPPRSEFLTRSGFLPLLEVRLGFRTQSAIDGAAVVAV